MSLARRVIPCLDVDAGRVVKGVQFVDIQDAGDPVEIARRYDLDGADELTFLDITASSDKRNILIDIVARVADEVFIPLTVGGGIREMDDIQRLLRAGADKVSINTTAISNPEFVTQASKYFGNQCIVVAIDAKRSQALVADTNTSRAVDHKWHVYSHGGRKDTGIDAVQWAQRMVDAGAGEILLTSMDNDGTKGGFNIPLTRTIADRVTVPVIASGGVGRLQHLVDGIVDGHADAVLAASIFHFGEFTILQAKQFLSDAGVEVRI